MGNTDPSPQDQANCPAPMPTLSPSTDFAATNETTPAATSTLVPSPSAEQQEIVSDTPASLLTPTATQPTAAHLRFTVPDAKTVHAAARSVVSVDLTGAEPEEQEQPEQPSDAWPSVGKIRRATSQQGAFDGQPDPFGGQADLPQVPPTPAERSLRHSDTTESEIFELGDYLLIRVMAPAGAQVTFVPLAEDGLFFFEVDPTHLARQIQLTPYDPPAGVRIRFEESVLLNVTNLATTAASHMIRLSHPCMRLDPATEPLHRIYHGLHEFWFALEDE